MRLSHHLLVSCFFTSRDFSLNPGLGHSENESLVVCILVDLCQQCKTTIQSWTNGKFCWRESLDWNFRGQDRRGRPQLHGELGTVPDTKKSRDKHYKFIADLNWDIFIICPNSMSLSNSFWNNNFTCYSKKSDENFILSNGDKDSNLRHCTLNQMAWNVLYHHPHIRQLLEMICCTKKFL